MPTTLIKRVQPKELEPQQPSPLAGPRAIFFGAILVTGACAAFAARALHWDFVLPLVSTVVLVLAAAAAAFGWRHRKADNSNVTYWDVAGALTLIGICAGAMIDPEQMLRVMEARTE